MTLPYIHQDHPGKLRLIVMIASLIVILLHGSILVGLHVLVSLKKLRETALRKAKNTPDLLKGKFRVLQQIAGYQEKVFDNPIMRAQARHAADSAVEMTGFSSHERGIKRHRALAIATNLPGKQVHVAVATGNVFKRYGRKAFALYRVYFCKATINGLGRDGKVLNGFHGCDFNGLHRQIKNIFNEIQQFYKIHSCTFNEIQHFPKKYMCFFNENIQFPKNNSCVFNQIVQIDEMYNRSFYQNVTIPKIY